MTPAEIAALLRDQLAEQEDGAPVVLTRELDGVADVLDAYLPDRDGLEIAEPQIAETADGVVVSGYAAVFGLPPVRTEVRFAVDGEEVALTIAIRPEMGVTAGGLFPELSGSGLWLPLASLAITLRSADADARTFAISAIVSPDLDELLRPLIHLLEGVAGFDGEGTIGPDGVLQKLRLGSKLIHAEVGPVKLDGNLALVAEDAGGGQVRSALAIEGTMTVALGARSITAGFQLTPARPDQAFHVLVARIAEGDTLDAPALGLPLPAGLPATLRLESLEVLLGAISGVPEEIAIHAALDGELHLIPLPVAIERLTGIFTIWPTATPVGGRAQLAGRVALGGSDMDFTLDIPEMDFAVTADPATTPNVKQLVEGLVGAPLPGGFPDLAITELGITGNSTRGQYQLRLRLAGEWSLKPLIGLDLALRSIRIAGQAQTTGAAVQRTGSITGAIHLGSPDDGAGVIELGAELTASGQWVLRGGLAAGSTLSLPQLVSVIGVAPSSMPGDLRSVVIDALAVSLDTGSGQASFAAAAGFSLALPFGLSSLSLHGGVTLAREGRDHAWQGEATAEVSFRSLRLRVAFPIDRAEVDPRFSLWLPRPGNPDDGQWLDCVVTKDASGAIKTLGFTLTTMNVFAAIEAFVNLMVPGLTIQFPWPWGELEKIPLPPTHVTIDPGEMSVALAITSGFGVINDIPGIHIDSVALALDLDDAKAALEVVGEFFGERYTPDEPLSWDPVTEDPPTPPLLPDLGFELRYLGLGRHVTLGDLSGVRHVRDAIELLRGAFDEDPRGGGAGLSKLRYSSESEWLVGLDFSVSGFLRLRMIFNDPYLYGLAIGLDGAAAGLFAGLEFEILYRRIGPGLGVYSIELELPPFMRIIELGAVTIALPVVAVDIYTNGNFKIDFGFPYGGDFARSFYISMIPFAGAGGFYYASLNGATSTSVPRITNGTFEPVIELGLGLTVGIGKRLGSGSFRLEVYVGVMAILEGVFATFQPYDPGASSATFFRITGMFRIVALVEGMVDFKIIAVSFSITLWVGATIRVQCYEPILLDVSASVSVRASIKIGWFRISFSFSASVSLSFSLGSRSATPWIVGDGPARARLARGGRARPPRPARMLASSDLAAGPSFDWTRGVPGRAKVALDWHVYFAVGVDLDRSTEGGGRIPVAVPLAGFFEETGGAGAHGATRWLERVFHWLLCAWHGTLPATTRFADARALDVELQDRGAAGRIGWSELSAFLEQNFTIALAPKPEPAAGSSFSVSMVPLPPVLELVFTVPGLEERRLDLSAGPLIGEDVLAGVARRGGRYARRPPPEAATSAGGAVAPMAEWLWKDVMTMQVKELATRLLKLMQACPVTVDEHDGFASIGDLYDRLVYDPDLSDAERRPFFEDFVVANVARAGLMRVDAELVIPRDGADDHDRVAVGDTLESIATRNGVTPADLVEANLDADVLAAGGTWIIPSIVELPVDDAWRRLVEAGAPADLAAMTSRFLLHGTRLDVGGAAINLYEAAGLQFDLPATEATGAPPPKLRVVHAAGSPGAGWLSLDSLEIELGPNERGSLDRLLGDPAFEPKARVTGMAITQEVAVELGLARAIPVRRARDDGGDAEPDGQIRLLPRAFFDLLAQRAAQGLPPVEGWRAHPGRRSTGAAAAVDELAYEWTTRLDVDVSRLGKDEALAGRTVYRITGLEPEARLRLHRLLGDLQRGAAQATVVPAVGVAGPASASGGLIAGRPDAAAIVLFRNDADDRPETPARADNRTQAAFLQLLAESVAEEPGTFFFADVLPGVKGVDDAIFAGGEKGVITLLIHLSGDADLTRYADGIHVAALDPGSTVVRLSAPGLTEKVAHVPPDQLQFRIERPEPHEDDADALESLYSLVSFSFAAADGSDPSPASLPLGPRSETEGFWLYEQTVPFAAAFATREERPPYADVGKTRSLRLAWRDIFGNEAIQAGARFAGRSTPAAAFAADLAALPLSCFYYDD
ncbi:MAG TPA: LysM peptidoglycan-binding domain-containing protein, partial [Kofleriaceae bacterium]|nr:LysM peptidoglycan-binding domain-containing protein [Kofleriaceae bacterium]